MELYEGVFMFFIDHFLHEHEDQILNNNTFLATLASYFWPNLTSDYKTYWKNTAAVLNTLTQRNKKFKKMTGFWAFAKSIQYALIYRNCAVFHQIWHNTLPGYQSVWQEYIHDIIYKEIVKIRNA